MLELAADDAGPQSEQAARLAWGWRRLSWDGDRRLVGTTPTPERSAFVTKRNRQVRRIAIGLAAVVVAIGGWIGMASWQWSHIDPASIFRARIDAEAPSGTKIVVTPGSIVVGELDDTDRLVCGTASRQDAGGAPSETTYSLIVIKTMFGHRINDGYTPATRPENQAVSDQNCTALRAHAASHSGNTPG